MKLKTNPSKANKSFICKKAALRQPRLHAGGNCSQHPRNGKEIAKTLRSPGVSTNTWTFRKQFPVLKRAQGFA